MCSREFFIFKFLTALRQHKKKSLELKSNSSLEQFSAKSHVTKLKRSISQKCSCDFWSQSLCPLTKGEV